MFSRSVCTLCLSWSLTACVVELSTPAEMQDEAQLSMQIQQDETATASASGNASAESDSPAKRLTRTVQVVGADGPVSGARIAVRDAAGRPWWSAQTNAEGWLPIDVPANAYVVAAAPGMAPAGRQGPGRLTLVQRERAVESARVRLQNKRPVWEVVAGSATVPLAAGLSEARAAGSQALPSAPPHFLDTSAHAAALHIAALRSRGIVAGDPDGRFRPDDAVTRAEAVTILLRALDMPLSAYDGAFRDVDASAWYAKAVGTAAALGLVSGYPDGRFQPTAEVKRAEVAALLYQMTKLADADPAQTRGAAVPGDLRRTHWAYETIVRLQAWCGAFDLDGNNVRPNEPATRAELATAMSRVLACQLDRAPKPSDPIANAAAETAWSTHTKHHASRRDTGIGTHYGDTSTYHNLSDAEKRNFLAEHVRNGLTAPALESLTRSSCVEYSMELASGGFFANDLDDVWADIDEDTRDDQLRGTRLTQELVEAGWRAYFFNDDASYRGITSVDGEHQYALAEAERTHEYYGTPLHGIFVADTELHRASMEQLKFGIFVMRGGTHVVAIADGTVHELARSEGPTQHVLYADPWKDIIEIYTEQVYGGAEDAEDRARRLWHSGVIVVPPGTQLAGAKDL